MNFSNESLAGAPALLVCRESVEKASRQGSVLVYHGLGASKETQQKELESLASRGFLAVGVDCVGHGGRQNDFPDLPDITERDILRILSQTAAEVPQVVTALRERGAVSAAGVGLVGISLGGFMAYRAILEEPGLRAVAPLLASPVWPLNAPESPHLFPDRFFPVPLLSQTAGRDESVRPGAARSFHERLRPLYSRAPERLQYLEYPESGHFMKAHEWERAWEEVLQWMLRFLHP